MIASLRRLQRRIAPSPSLPNVGEGEIRLLRMTTQEERRGANGMRKVRTKKRKKKRNTIPTRKTMRWAKAHRVRLSVHIHLLGGALRAMTQLTEVTAPIRLTTPTIPELNLMAEVLETESANHRQLVSRTRGTSRNLTSVRSLHSPRHNCGALGV